GGVMDAWMMVPNWQKGVSTPHGMNCGLERLIDHMDHICQLAGNANHIAIGSDLDGGFGKEQSPFDLESIADLDKLPSLLAGRGYKAEDIDKVTHRNWLEFLLRVWK
ncbi:MAG: membrane dipeptidase, partial [Bacteroidota bacterium]